MGLNSSLRTGIEQCSPFVIPQNHVISEKSSVQVESESSVLSKCESGSWRSVQGWLRKDRIAEGEDKVPVRPL